MTWPQTLEVALTGFLAFFWMRTAYFAKVSASNWPKHCQPQRHPHHAGGQSCAARHPQETTCRLVLSRRLSIFTSTCLCIFLTLISLIHVHVSTCIFQPSCCSIILRTWSKSHPRLPLKRGNCYGPSILIPHSLLAASKVLPNSCEVWRISPTSNLLNQGHFGVGIPLPFKVRSYKHHYSLVVVVWHDPWMPVKKWLMESISWDMDNALHCSSYITVQNQTQLTQKKLFKGENWEKQKIDFQKMRKFLSVFRSSTKVVQGRDLQHGRGVGVAVVVHTMAPALPRAVPCQTSSC